MRNDSNNRCKSPKVKDVTVFTCLLRLASCAAPIRQA